nr:NADH-quinone oxidoreductase subunit A [Candidatus Tachikawaea gelatinosa]
MNIEYLRFIIYVFVIVFFCAMMLIGGWLLGGRSDSRYKNTPFESGINPIGSTYREFSTKFYLIAIFFVIFDIEAIFLYSWAISIRETSWTGFFEATIFIFILLTSLFYLIRIDALNWLSKNKNKVNLNK